MKKLLSIILISFLAFSLNAQEKGKGFNDISKVEKVQLQKLKSEFTGAGGKLLKTMLKSYGDADASSFDLRKIKGVTPIKDQGRCGSCWAFSTLATIESSYALLNSSFVDLSEQSLIYCAPDELGSCEGGHYYMAAIWLLTDEDSFLQHETDYPYDENNTKCPSNNIVRSNIGLTEAGFIERENFDSNQEFIQTVKLALTEFGALSAAVKTSGTSFMNYKGQGVINDSGSNLFLDHAINVIGWDDGKQAWLVKNSWGEYWGDKGYGWVGYNALGIDQFMLVETMGIDENNDKNKRDDDDQKVIFNLTDVLGKTQEYQEIYVKIDNDEPFRFYMNQKNKLYHNYIPVKKGKHKVQIVTKSVVKKNNKRAMIFGVLKGDMEFKGNRNYELKYGDLIKNNVFNLELERVKRK